MEQSCFLNENQIVDFIRQQKSVEISNYLVSQNFQVYKQKILKLFLSECHQKKLEVKLDFCLNELLTNALKANSKRAYFKEKHFNIENPDDYKKGMKAFKNDIFSDEKQCEELHEKYNLYVKLIFQQKENEMFIEIRNNSILAEEETKRIQTRIKNAKKFSSLEEVYTKALDQSEGSGLGIIIVILMLQELGLSKDNYRIFSTDKETITQLILPFKASSKEEIQHTA